MRRGGARVQYRLAAVGVAGALMMGLLAACTLTSIVEIVTGAAHACALGSDGKVQCWGSNTYGQLGLGTTTDERFAREVPGLAGVVSLDAGLHHTCAALNDGTARCWGRNAYGQLGDGTSTNRSSPVPVSGVTAAAGISAGGFHSCVRRSDGSARCWGRNLYGQLGDGTNTNRSTPVTVSGLAGASGLDVGTSHSCAWMADTTARCWGLNADGQLGNGTNTDSNVPVTVSGLSGASAVSAGKASSCALVGAGAVSCWGRNANGQLGDGTTISRTTPVAVVGLSTAAQVSVGDLHACARLSDASARCWGEGGSGQLGTGGTADSAVPVVVTGLTDAAGIASGGTFTCARRSDTLASAKCWGANASGQLGDGSTTGNSAPTGSVANFTVDTKVSTTPGIVDLSWFPPEGTAEGVLAYYIQVDNGGGFAPLDSTSATSYAATVVSGSTFRWRVIADYTTAPDSISQASSQIQSSLDAPAPAVATISSTPGEVDLSWSAPTGTWPATSYRVVRFSDGVYDAEMGTVTGTSMLGANASGVGPFTYKVQAINAVDSSALSGPSNAIAPVLNAPTGVSATFSSTAAQADVSWTASTGTWPATSYQVFQYVDGVPTGVTVVVGTTSATIAAAGGSNTYTVLASNSVLSAPTSSASAGIAPFLNAPSSISASSLGSGWVRVSWTAPAGTWPAGSYSLFVYKNGTLLGFVGGTSGATTVDMFNILGPGTYSYHAVADNATNTSVASGVSNGVFLP